MDKLVMLKSSRYGLEIHLNPQAEFSKLLREMERKLKASIKFFERWRSNLKTACFHRQKRISY